MTNADSDIFSAKDLCFNPPTFEVSDLIDLLQRQYGIEGEFRELAGERDQNFQVSCTDGRRFVFKISSIDEDFSRVDLQIRALEHIRSADPELPVPRQVTASDGQLVSQMSDSKGNAYNARLLTYLDGTPMTELGAPGQQTIRSLGRMQARLCLALQGFSHPAATHFMPWDSMNGLVVSKTMCRDYLPPPLAKTCAPVLERLRQVVLPGLLQMPSQVIHNDVNMGNALVDPGQPEVISGVIDFGDLVKRPLVIDLASSLAMIIEYGAEVSPSAASLVAGFEALCPLPGNQRELLYDALCARAILSVQLVKYYRDNVLSTEKYDEDDYYRTISSLERILATDSRDFTSAIQPSGGH
ncbi:MAG: phosphotransferase [Gammaproteobacteria bacterium]|nr:phosphotransferase [Gammaproteobacteria bacterium]